MRGNTESIRITSFLFLATLLILRQIYMRFSLVYIFIEVKRNTVVTGEADVCSVCDN